MTVSRYAPSPTGPLHMGNVRTALLAWLQARLSGAKFILRMEDLDLPRVIPDSARQIIDDMLWLGLDWDEGPQITSQLDNFYQSRRTHLYEQVLIELYSQGLIFPCYCSRKDIREAASAPHDKLPVYPGTCRDQFAQVTPFDEQLIKGRKPAWRFKVTDEIIQFNDRICGRVSQHVKTEVGDFVVRRSDGLFAYQLAVVADDIAMQVTDVLRGEDLLDSTCRQIMLYNALKATIPDYWHVKLMVDNQGKRMSKRDGSDSLDVLRKQGMSAQTVIGELAYNCGLIDKKQKISVNELLEELTQDRFISRSQSQVVS